ncbi:glycosyltransferase [Pseudarthrobacter sp. NamE2]|uniref:glycosyltransferase n=1 Tax=Pseudarthrobacter sp. NamE2 TaxID=2576838 RepID=UPI0010FEB75E|nr:glycosyltransferase [Pseudarthrobacter sp. NamE2]TLM83910.1 glycosyltransferase [Pseudarthrobacter sp. NamE2]
MTSTLVPTTRTDKRLKLRDVWCALAGLASLVLAVGAAASVVLPVNSDLGLVAVLPYPYWVGLLLLNVTFVVALRGDATGPASRPVMMWLLAVQVLVLFGAAAFVTDVPRGEVAFRHLGIADALGGTGAVDPNIDAYFNWPGFFALLATVLQATGLDPLTVALWAPVFNVGLWLVAVAVLMRYLTQDPRRRWLVLWIFCLGNWQDQDYLSPQAFGFFLYLVVAVLLIGPLAARPSRFRGFRPSDLAAWWRERSPSEHRPGFRVGALAAVILLVTVICASHQLTPFMLLITITVLTLSGRVWPGRLPLITAILLVLWLVYPASTYLIGHPPMEDAGLSAAVESNVAERVSGTPGHVFVVQVRVVLTVLLWLLALAGAVRDWRRRRLDIRVVLFAVSPMLLFPSQMYGGEMLIRVSLFALPFIALLASSALLPKQCSTRPSFKTAGALVLIFCLLAAMTVTGRFGNARYDVFTDNEMAAIAAAESMAPPGAAILSAAHPTPWRTGTYLEHQHRAIEDLCRQDLTAATCGPTFYNYARNNPAGGFVVLMRSTEASLVLQGDSTTNNMQEMEQWFKAQDGVELVLSNADARVYRVVP